MSLREIKEPAAFLMRNAFSGWWQRTDAIRLPKDDNFGTFMPLSSMPFDMCKPACKRAAVC
jgi:hypothetical protein